MSKQLIYALSSLGSVNLDKYRELFSILYRPGNSLENDDTAINYRGQVSRVLDSLGYLEFNYDLRKVFVCPPALITLPDYGLPKFLLTGARTKPFLSKLKQLVHKNKNVMKIQRYAQNTGWFNLPDKIVLKTADIESLKQIAKELDIFVSLDNPAAWKIADFSASVGDIEQNLKFTPREEINWKKRVFDINRLEFNYANEKAAEYILSEYTHPVTQQKMHWLWNGNEAAVINRDWGRYFILNKLGVHVLIYDEAKQLLAVPVTIPLPKLIARAVALCSGTPPLLQRIESEKIRMYRNPLFYIYRDIPVEIAEVITQKTGQKIILSKLKIK